MSDYLLNITPEKGSLENIAYIRFFALLTFDDHIFLKPTFLHVARMPLVDRIHEVTVTRSDHL